jgi:hypothetical protein
MVTSAYRSMGLNRMSQTGTPGRLSFSISASRVRLTRAISAAPNITEVTPSYFDGNYGLTAATKFPEISGASCHGQVSTSLVVGEEVFQKVKRSELGGASSTIYGEGLRWALPCSTCLIWQNPATKSLFHAQRLDRCEP